MWHKLTSLISPKNFFYFSSYLLPWLTAFFLLSFSYGLIGGLALAPADYQQGDGFRIIYVHVPVAFLSLFVYVIMTGAAFSALVWRLTLNWQPVGQADVGNMVDLGCAPDIRINPSISIFRHHVVSICHRAQTGWQSRRCHFSVGWLCGSSYHSLFGLLVEHIAPRIHTAFVKSVCHRQFHAISFARHDHCLHVVLRHGIVHPYSL